MALQGIGKSSGFIFKRIGQLKNNNLKKTKELVEKVLALPEDKRADFLTRQCNNVEIIKEVQSLIKAYEKADDFLDKPLIINPDDIQPFEDPNIGKEVGNYLIEKTIGVGGMGIVYLGRRNDKAFEKKVAIKILKYGFSSEYLLKRFRAERQTLANLQHQNIARLIDGGRTTDGLPYLIMEYVDGIQITKYCHQNNLNLHEKLKLFKEVCQAIQYAHQSLIIHRDIKPGNILVTKEGKPKLLDFGIAKIIDDELSNPEAGITMTGMWHLTPEYASPEQVNSEKVTTASDVYSLGVLLYRILTNSQPIEITKYSPLEISKIITESIAVKPSEKVKESNGENRKEGSDYSRPLNPDKLSRQLKGDLDNIVLKAIHKDSAQRYSSVQEFSDDINRYLNGLPVLARKDTILYTTSKFVKRHKLGVAVFFIFQLLILTGIILINNQRNIASEQRDKAQIELSKFEAINEFLLEMLSSADPGIDSKDIKVYDLLEKAAGDIEIKFREHPAIQTALKQTLGTTFMSLGEYNKAEILLLESHTSNIALFGHYSKETAKSAHQAGLLYDWVGNYPLSDSFYNAGITIYEKLSKNPPLKGLADNLNDYGTFLTNLGKYDSADTLFNRALEIYAYHNPNEKGKKEAVTTINIAVNMHHQYKWEEAEKYYLEAKDIFERLYSENIPEMASLYNNLAFIYLDNKNFEKAENAFKKALEIKLDLLGENHPNLGLSYINLGMLYFIIEDYNNAESSLQEAIGLFHRTESLKDPTLSLAYYWLGRVYLKTSSLAKSELAFQNSLKIREEILPEGNYKIWSARGELGVCLLKQKRYSEAEELLSTSLEFFKNDSYVDKKKITRYTEHLAILYKKTGDQNKSEIFYAELAKLNAETVDQ